jgi:hypothetical protein
MKAKPKFYINTFVVTVLTQDEPMTDVDLDTIHYETMEGNAVLQSVKESYRAISGKQMAHELLEAASDPGFFELDINGKTVED